ncbi:DNA replication endonuclease-helicase Dna2 [Rhodotorula kratochvilovae]
MPRVAGEDAFMASLLAGLDAGIFTSPPSSSQPATSQRPPARPPKRPAASQGQPLTTTPRKRAARPAPPPDQPFWADPLARPPLTPRALQARDETERAHGYAPGLGRDALRGKKGDCAMQRGKGGNALGVEEGPRRVRRVEIDVEGKENAEKARGEDLRAGREGGGKREARVKQEVDEVRPPAPRIKVDHVEEVVTRDDADEFGDLLGGVDWDEAMLGFEDEQASETAYARCVVEEVVDNFGSTSKPQKIVTISSPSFEGLRQVLLCDDWVDAPVKTGDTVNLVDLPDLASSPADTPLQLTRSSGLLILHPDILVSSTKVADSSHCTRKAVLQELIRTLGQSTPSLLYGNMLHALLQSCMSDNTWDDEYRFARIDDIVKENGGMLWELEVSFDKARMELRERSKEFEAFAERFAGDKPKADAFLSDPRALDTARSRLAITSTLGIEDDIWSPRFGLKGKIDVSTSAAVVDSIGFTRRGTTPFEIKTGRTSAGMEHRAQTMLYTLLMTDRYDQDVDSGLLYYTQSNEIFRVQAARNEIRGLILARNRFATFLHRRMTLSPSGAPASTQRSAIEVQPSSPATAAESDDEAELWDEVDVPACSVDPDEADKALLPPPIDDERSCKKCYVRDACMLFRRADGELAISEDDQDPLQLLYEDKTGHLTDVHAAFFQQWERLISFEEQELVRFKKEIWTLTAEEREKAGRCFGNMVVTEVKLEDEQPAKGIHRYAYRLRPQTPPHSQSQTLLGGSISVNDPIVISLEDPPLIAISRGFVLALTPYEVVVGVDRSLTDLPQAKGVHAERVFRVDKDELAAGMGRIRDNLIQLFVPGGDERRRRLVVDLEPPTFDAALAASSDRLIPSSLNGDQKLALERVLAAQDYALILGMPGTGKTTTIAEVIRVLARAGKSVLLTSYTHSAVDNILLKLKDDGLNILRLGNRDKILPALHDLTLTPGDYATSLTDIDQKLMMPQIVATTCLGINEPIFVKRRFDVCIVDEASQVTLPTCLGPLRFADKFVLVGDHHQLPPLVRNSAARKGGLDVSLFKRLSDAHPAAVVNLTHQYRMSEDIMLLSNKLVYSDQLRVGAADVGNRRLELPQREKTETMEPWLREVVDPARTVLFVDTDALPAHERRQGSLIDNELEAALIKQTVSALSTCGVAPADIGVITLYRQQIKLLSRLLEPSFPGVEVLTADRSQGRDKECILVSLVRSNTGGHVGDLLKDWRRINVVLTRAKAKLVVFGSRSTLAHNPLMRRFLDLVTEKEWVYALPAGLEVSLVEDARVKNEVKDEEEEKPLRQGAGALALRKPLAADVLNSMA